MCGLPRWGAQPQPRHSPALLLLVFLLTFPADPAIWLDWQNGSGKPACVSCALVQPRRPYVCTRSERRFTVAEIARLHFGVHEEAHPMPSWPAEHQLLHRDFLSNPAVCWWPV